MAIRMKNADEKTEKNRMPMTSAPTENGKKVLTMAEYIEREALLCMVQPDDPSDEKAAITIATAKKLIRNIVSRTPSSDVALERHGRWIDGDPYCPICKKDKFRGLDADVWADWKPDYCPNCGAIMDLKEA